MTPFDQPNTTPAGLLGSPESSSTGIRIFNYTIDKSILGVLKLETEDSFLIYFPSRLLAYEDKRMVEPYMMVPYIRQLKSAISSVLPAYGEFEKFYIKYLLDNAKEAYPNFEQDIYPGYMAVLEDRYKQLNPTEPIVEVEQNSDVSGEEELIIIPAYTSKLTH